MAPALLVLAVLALALVAAFPVNPPPGDDAVALSVARSGPADGAEAEVRSRSAEDPTAESLSSRPATNSFGILRNAAAVVYATDFTSLDDDWTVYDSEGHAGRGLRRPSAVTIEPDPTAEGGSVLRITARMGSGDEAGELVSGGLALSRPRVTGTYTFRMRIGSDPDEGTSGVAILWPRSNQWPRDGEIDMVETWGDRITRTPVETNIHSLDPDAVEPYTEADDRLLTVRHEGVDGREWHIYRFEWRADELAMTVDDGARQILTDDPSRIPAVEMVPTFQLDAFPTPDAPFADPVLTGEVTLEVDWLVIEE